MDSQRGTGRTTRLVLRALHELLAQCRPLDYSVKDLYLVLTVGDAATWGRRAVDIMRSLVAGITVKQGPSGVYDIINLQGPWLRIHVVAPGQDRRGRLPSVLCIDHAAEDELNSMPQERGWGMLPIAYSHVVVRDPERADGA